MEDALVGMVGDAWSPVMPLTAGLATGFGVDVWWFLWRWRRIVSGVCSLRAVVRIPRQGMTSEGAEAEVEAMVSSNLAAIRAAAIDPGLLRWALILPLLDMPVKAFVVLYFHDVVSSMMLLPVRR